jgi:hypothetical protein
MINLRSQYAQDMIFEQFYRFLIIIETFSTHFGAAFSKIRPKSNYCTKILSHFKFIE